MIQPFVQRPTAHREGGGECGRTSHSSPVRAVIREDDEATNHGGAPTLALVDDLRCQADLSVKRPEQLLHRHEARLDFHDENGPVRPPSGE